MNESFGGNVFIYSRNKKKKKHFLQLLLLAWLHLPLDDCP